MHTYTCTRCGTLEFIFFLFCCSFLHVRKGLGSSGVMEKLIYFSFTLKKSFWCALFLFSSEFFFFLSFHFSFHLFGIVVWCLVRCCCFLGIKFVRSITWIIRIDDITNTPLSLVRFTVGPVPNSSVVKTLWCDTVIYRPCRKSV